MMLETKNKVVVYVLSGSRLLVFSHEKYPEVGYQVPAGTIEIGETALEAAARELLEEAGISSDLKNFVSLGKYTHDMRPFKNELHVRNYFCIFADNEHLEKWTHFEEHSNSTKDAHPTEFSFKWMDTRYNLNSILSVGQGNYLHAVPGIIIGVAPFQRLEYREINQGIQIYRKERVAKIIELISSLSMDLGIDTVDFKIIDFTAGASYAALEQCFFTLIQGAETNNSSQVNEGIRLLQELPKLTSNVTYISKHKQDIALSNQFESPAYISDFSPANEESHIVINKFKSAIGICEKFGFSDTVKDYVGNVCILQERDIFSATNSYTLSGLPSTIYTDYIDNAYRLAEILIHEGSHNWLNEVLRAYEIKLDAEARFFSPWRHKLRPAVGILHAAFVFSRLTCFYSEVLRDKELLDYERTYFASKLASEKATIVDHLELLIEVIGMIDNIKIRSIISEELNRSINLN